MPRKVFLNLETLKFPYPSLIYLVCLIALGLTASPSTTASGPAEFILGWDANAEADLDGYEIYVRKGTADTSYLFLSEVYVDELEDPDNPRVTITDLYNGLLTDMITPVVRIAELSNNSTYHFALTAFDTQGNISDFSEELCVEVIGTSVAECRSADDGSDPGETDGNDSETIDSGDGSGGDVSAENSVNSSSGGGGGCFIETSLSNFH